MMDHRTLCALRCSALKQILNVLKNVKSAIGVEHHEQIECLQKIGVAAMMYELQFDFLGFSENNRPPHLSDQI